MRRLELASVLVLVCASPSVAACSSPRPPPHSSAITPTPAALALPAARPVGDPVDPADPIPLSIQRLLSEERSELRDVVILAGPVGDTRGRARARAEVTALADDLRDIEADLRAAPQDSEHLDAIVVKLHRLETRIALLHEALVIATGPTTAVELEGRTPQ